MIQATKVILKTMTKRFSTSSFAVKKSGQNGWNSFRANPNPTLVYRLDVPCCKKFNLNMMANLFLVVFCASLMVFVAYGDTSSEYVEGARGKSDCPLTRMIVCACGIGETHRMLTVQQDIDSDNSEQEFNGCPVFPDPYLACATHNCILAHNQSLNIPSLNELRWKRNIIDSMYPQVFTIPSGYEGHRYARQTDACQIPNLKNASIKCLKWPNWMYCGITCIHGYALADQKDSRSRVNINCRKTENIWRPHGFIDCQPFLNCKAHLTKPGDLKCKEPVEGPAFCEISCMDYDEFDATPRQKYECVDENFGKSLPHCASLKDVQLVRRPKE